MDIPAGTPRRFAVLLYRQWESIDVMGPLEALNTLSRDAAKDLDPPFSLNIITPNSEPASTAPKTGQGSLVNQRVLATHGYNYNPDPKHQHDDLLDGIPEADVLLVPGGYGPPKGEERDGVIEFLRQYYQRYLKGRKDRYLFTVCTGSNLAAQAGCLDHMYATTNKSAWHTVTSANNLTYWIAEARWVDSGNIWTTSGVSSGTDGFLAWMKKLYTEKIIDQVITGMEYNAWTDATKDRFSTSTEKEPSGEIKVHNLEDVCGNSGLRKPKLNPSGVPE